MLRARTIGAGGTEMDQGMIQTGYFSKVKQQGSKFQRNIKISSPVT